MSDEYKRGYKDGEENERRLCVQFVYEYFRDKPRLLEIGIDICKGLEADPKMCAGCADTKNWKPAEFSDYWCHFANWEGASVMRRIPCNKAPANQKPSRKT